MQDIFQSKVFKGIILLIAGLIILAFVFSMGVVTGARRADFSSRWADHYQRNFGEPLSNANGSFGQIIKIGTDNITVKDAKDNVEKNIAIETSTTIVLQRKNIKLSDLKIGDNVVIIGEPNDVGQIEAQLIRVMPQAVKNINQN